MASMSLIQGELSIDFSNLAAHSDEELEVGQELIEKELTRRRELAKRAAIDKAQLLMQQHGLTAEEVQRLLKPRRTRSSNG